MHQHIDNQDYSQLFAHDELDDQMAEASARKSEYDEWRGNLAADCHIRGIAVPSGYALQRAWNEHQKKQKAARKKEATRKRLIALLAQLDGKTPDADDDLPDFDAIDRQLRANQDLIESQRQQALRDQQALMNATQEPEIAIPARRAEDEYAQKLARLKELDAPNDGEEV